MEELLLGAGARIVYVLTKFEEYEKSLILALASRPSLENKKILIFFNNQENNIINVE